MSPVAPKLAVLALAGSALAHPNFGHGHHAKQHHHKHFFGSSGVATGTGAPYGLANATGIWGTGTGTGVSSHGLAASTGLATGFPHPSPVGPETASEVAPASSSSCTDSVVRVTHTNRVTVTVHPSDAAPAHTTLSTRANSNSAVLSSSVVASSSPAPASSASVSLDLEALQNKGYKNHRKTWRSSSSAAASTAAAAAQSTSKSSAVAVSTQASSTSTSVYVAPSSSAVAASSSAKASSTSSSAVAQSSSTGSGKRGLAYNTASLLTCFEGNDHVSWGYNWDSQSFGLASSFNYVPLLWGTSADHTTQWNTVATEAIANGATHLMSFNEPDMSTQSNLSPTEAAKAYMTYMMPFAGKAKLGAPAVTNGGGSMGLNWLSAFMDACTGCQIDFVSIHWYDSFQNTAYFKEHVQNATDVSGKPVWITEFAPTDGSDSDVGSFLQEVMPWMDSQSFVERYSFFMAADGKLISGTEPSSYGQIYATYNGA